MRAITVQLEAPELEDPALFSQVLIHLCEALIMVNRAHIRAKRLPPLYQSGVIYKREPKRKLRDGRIITVENFRDAACCYARGWGDCEDLASIRIAELREAGENARPVVTLQRFEKRKLWHVKLLRATGVREDPSKRLGM
jgi:hypothetical protein